MYRIKILLICSTNVSTSILAKALQKYMRENEITGAVKTATFDDIDDSYKNYDVALLVPQVAFLYDRILQKITKIPVRKIDQVDYDLARGEVIFKKIKKLLIGIL